MTDPTNFFTLTFVGDVMLGRLVDQFFPEHVNNDNDHRSAEHFIEKHPSILGPGNYTPSSPWGTTLPLLRASDLCLINLETSVTTTSELWPDKVFNYRMHPSNLGPILHAAHVDYASLANNHTLDFGKDGLIETAWTLRSAGIAFTGAGETPDQAFKPAVLYLPRQAQEIHSRRADGQKKSPLPSKGKAI
ncbi:putative polyglutamine synthesis accessory protein [Penicillium rolfsii]|nr:putative polyglutamine synthesis accessory protein [Penicillium rolfsii]